MVDASAIGRSLAPTHARVEPGRLRFFLNALGESNPVYRDPAAAKAAGFAATPIPPTYFFCLEMMDADDPFAMLECAGHRSSQGAARRAEVRLSRARRRRRRTDPAIDRHRRRPRRRAAR